MEDFEFDCLVVGGGIVGLTAVLELSRLGFSVVFIEKYSPKKGPFDLNTYIRNVSISHASHELLARHVDLPLGHAGEFTSMVIWEESGTEVLRFGAEDAGRDQLGWVFEVTPLQEAIWRKVESLKNVELLFGEIEAIDLTSGGVRAQFGSREISARFMVAADGASSSVKSALKVRTRVWSVGDAALATVIQFKGDHESTAWQKFTADGPIALLPSKDKQICSVVWSQPLQLLEKRLAASEEDFIKELQILSGDKLGVIEKMGMRISFPIFQRLADSPMPMQRVFLVGDALRAVHPLAGQGVNLGIEDVRSLADLMKSDRQPSRSEIRNYVNARRLKSLSAIKLMSAIRQGYRAKSFIPVMGKKSVLSAINSSAMLKKLMVAYASGL